MLGNLGVGMLGNLGAMISDTRVSSGNPGIKIKKYQGISRELRL